MKLPEDVRRMFANWGTQGGRSKSKNKVRASKLNGKKGGRPRKKVKRNG